MYNGIGLQTPRGSGTNGYVQKNLAFVRDDKPKVARNSYNIETDTRKLDADLIKVPNKEILDHDRKRRIEIQCLEMRDLMEEQGFAEDEIEAKVSDFRNALLAQLESGDTSQLGLNEGGKQRPKDTHEMAEASIVKNDRFRDALGISSLFVEGSSLDEAKRREREQVEREQRERERREREQAATNRRDRRFELSEQTRYKIVREEVKAGEQSEPAPSRKHDESQSADEHESEKWEEKREEKREKKRKRDRPSPERSDRVGKSKHDRSGEKREKKQKQTSDDELEARTLEKRARDRKDSRSRSQSQSPADSDDEKRKKQRQRKARSHSASASESESEKRDRSTERHKHKHSRKEAAEKDKRKEKRKKDKHREKHGHKDKREREPRSKRRSSADRASRD